MAKHPSPIVQLMAAEVTKYRRRREKGRRPLDFYETPPHYVHSLTEAMPVLLDPDVVVFEPCVGDHAISSHFNRVYTNDIDPDRLADEHLDATQGVLWRRVQRKLGFDEFSPTFVTVSNPPFNKATEIVWQALNHTTGPVIMCLRLSFLEPTEKRRELLRVSPPDSLIVLPRYSFRLNDQGKRATDSVTCAWMGWRTHLLPSIRVGTARA